MVYPKKDDQEQQGLFRLADELDKSDRGTIFFKREDPVIEYIKLIRTDEAGTFPEMAYYQSLKQEKTYPEWVFEGAIHRYDFRQGSRFPLSNPSFIKDALSQADGSRAILVHEERVFEETETEQTLQYYKILSSDAPEKEFYHCEFRRMFRFGYKRGSRYPLIELQKAKEFAENNQGFVVKVTERFLDKAELSTNEVKGMFHP